MTKKNKSKRQQDRSQDPPRHAERGPEAQPGPADAAADLKASHDEMLARLQRVTADYQNYQKRVQRDVAQAREYANEELMKAMLGILDDMERALEAGRANHDPQDPLLVGLQLAHDNALAVLERFGLTQIEAVGRPFDPARHSAMMQQPTNEHPPQIILNEIQKGYRFKGRTLRPSAVVVAVEAEDDAGDDEANEPASN